MKLDLPITRRWQTIHVLSSWAIALLAFSLTLFRVCTQSIAHDEALTYLWHLRGGVANLLTYSANNHVLYTLISKVFVYLLGLGEIPLRLASLIGAAIYVVISHLLGRRLFGDSALLPLATSLLCLNPNVMDFLVAARGYGLGLAFLLVSVYCITGLDRCANDDLYTSGWRWNLILAGFALALSASSNLTNIVPAVSLGCALLVVLYVGGSVPFESKREVLKSLGTYFAIPTAFVYLFIMWPYLIQARPSQFYIGHEQASVALRDLFNSIFLFRWTDDPSSLSAVATPRGSWQSIVSDIGSLVILPLLFFVVVVGTISTFVQRQEEQINGLFQTRIVGTTSILCVIGMAGLHLTRGINYPVNRTCLFLIPLFTLSLLLVMRRLSSCDRLGFLKPIGLSIGMTTIIVYVASIHLTYFRYNAYDEDSLNMFLSVMNDIKSHGLENVRIGGSWWYEPVINFYSAKYKAKQIGTYDVVDASWPWQTPNRLSPTEYDYFIFTPKNAPALEDRNSRIIFHCEKTKTTIVAIKK